MTSSPGVIPREGEIAFARSVSTLYDLTVGTVHWPVWLRKTDTDPEVGPPLTLSNVVPGGVCLDILRTSNDRNNPAIRFTNEGIQQTQIGGFLDLHNQEPGEPGPPAADSGNVRMYARDGNLYFRVSGSGEQQFLIGEPPGSAMRFAFWLSGG